MHMIGRKIDIYIGKMSHGPIGHSELGGTSRPMRALTPLEERAVSGILQLAAGRRTRLQVSSWSLGVACASACETSPISHKSLPRR